MNVDILESMVVVGIDEPQRNDPAPLSLPVVLETVSAHSELDQGPRIGEERGW